MWFVVAIALVLVIILLSIYFVIRVAGGLQSYRLLVRCGCFLGASWFSSFSSIMVAGFRVLFRVLRPRLLFECPNLRFLCFKINPPLVLQALSKTSVKRPPAKTR